MKPIPMSIKHLMPVNEEGWQEYRKTWNCSNLHWGVKLFEDWFYIGLEPNAQFYPKEGIDPEQAIRHIRAIMGSYEPSYEDRTAACGFLFEHWFEKVEYKVKEK